MTEFENKLLEILADEQVSDLHLTVGEPVWCRLSGDMKKHADLRVEEAGLLHLCKAFGFDGPVNQLAEPRQDGKDGHGFSTTFGEFRLRGDLNLTQRKLSLVLRKLNDHIPSVEELSLPKALVDQSVRPTGLVLVTGATGSGKSTTLAALLDNYNEHKNGHIYTIEDPVEYLLKSKNCKITQREVGSGKDASSFSAALRSAMRDDPDAIMIGEVRDYETVRAAFSAAESGHLVFATMHTNSSIKTIDRVLSFFPADEKDWARSVFATVLNCIMSQVLVPKIEGIGRAMGYELLVNDSTVTGIINEGKIVLLKSQLTNPTTPNSGNRAMNKTLEEMVRNKRIAKAAAIAHSHDPKALEDVLRGVS